jgi:hypothetical protein
VGFDVSDEGVATMSKANIAKFIKRYESAKKIGS